MKNNYFYILSLFCILLIVKQSSAKPKLSEDDSLIYKTVYDNLSKGNKYLVYDITINPRTHADSNLVTSFKFFEEQRKFAIDSTIVSRLSIIVDSTKNIKIVNETKINYITENDLESLKSGFFDFWNNFNSKYSDFAGFIMFSRIGYNLDSNKSAVFASLYCGRTCGVGKLFYLEKINGFWIVVDSIMLWIS